MYQYIAMGALAGLQLLNGARQAEAIREANQIQQQINDLNAQYAEIDAWEAEKHGYTQSSRYQSVIDNIVGEQRAALAANNVDVSSGTAAELQAESRVTGMLNQLDLISAAKKQAYGLRIQASNIRMGGDMQSLQANMNASSAQFQGFLGALDTGIKAAGVYERSRSNTSSNTGYEFER